MPIPPPSPSGCALVRLETFGGTFSRAFSYQEEQPGPLRGQLLPPVPQGGAEVSYHPLAHATCNAWSGLQVSARYEQVLYAYGTIADQTLRTNFWSARAGLGYSLAYGVWFALPSLSYQLANLEVDGGYLPNFGYRTVMFALRAGVRLGPVLLEGNGAYQVIENAGELTDLNWFPLAHGFGYALGGSLGVPLDRNWAIWLSAEQQVTRFELNPIEPYGYPHGIAKRMSDVSVSTLLSVRLTLGR